HRYLHPFPTRRSSDLSIVVELAFETPTRLGRYEVIRHLATGGMAEVLLARGHDEAGVMRHVVIKHIRPDQRRDHRFVQMFLDERSEEHTSELQSRENL